MTKSEAASMLSRAGWAKLTAAERSERQRQGALAAWSRLTPAERSERAKAGWKGTPEDRKARARKAWAKRRVKSASNLQDGIDVVA